jgi:hypothetical protein
MALPVFQVLHICKGLSWTASPRALIPRGNFIHGIDHEDVDRRFARLKLQPHIFLNCLEHRGAVAVVPG